MRTLATSDYRLIATDPDRVRYLRSLEFSFGIISKALKIPLTTVKRWTADLTATDVRGRRPLLSATEDQELLEFTVAAAKEHKPLTLGQGDWREYDTY